MNKDDVMRGRAERSTAALQAFVVSDIVTTRSGKLGAAAEYLFCAADVALRPGGFNAPMASLELQVATRERDLDGVEIFKDQFRPALLAILGILGLAQCDGDEADRLRLAESIRAQFDRRWPGAVRADEAGTWVDGLATLVSDSERGVSVAVQSIAVSTPQTHALLDALMRSPESAPVLAGAELTATISGIGSALAGASMLRLRPPQTVPLFRRTEVSLSARSDFKVQVP